MNVNILINKLNANMPGYNFRLQCIAGDTVAIHTKSTITDDMLQNVRGIMLASKAHVEKVANIKGNHLPAGNHIVLTYNFF